MPSARATAYKEVYEMRDQPPYMPSPEQIEAGCREIRAEWSREERAGRWSGGLGVRLSVLQELAAAANQRVERDIEVWT
jgi:hypothetical protein